MYFGGLTEPQPDQGVELQVADMPTRKAADAAFVKDLKVAARVKAE